MTWSSREAKLNFYKWAYSARNTESTTMKTSTAIAHRPGALQASQLDYILMDGSGSMQDKWWNMLAMLDQFMDVLKSQNIHSHGIAAVFDDEDLSLIQRDGLLSSWKTFVEDPLGAYWGGTPLYDAINHHVRLIKEMIENGGQQPDQVKVSLVIVTDGQDTGGRSQTTADQARAVLDWARACGWQVTFIGCDFSNYGQARLLGANDSNAIGVSKENLKEAGKLLGRKRVHHARTGDDINFTKDEQTQFGGYLPPPSK